MYQLSSWISSFDLWSPNAIMHQGHRADDELLIQESDGVAAKSRVFADHVA
jgi:hypothetical protein